MKVKDTKELLNNLGLNDFEYKEIVKKLKRVPNELECFLLSGMWSEHCGYKHSKKYLKMLPKANSLYAEENAGGVAIGNHIIFFKTESHNHPCAIEPYQGAATGIGGIVRDILALNARPFALMDSLKFGPPDLKRTKNLLEGVVDGISDYGNSIGVPTIGGETEFNACYKDSPLVNVFAAGIVHKDKVKLSGAKCDSYIVLVGSLTGRDGLFGASFASKNLDIESNKERSSVQIADPYTKKNLIEATLKILNSSHVFSCQDLGAAGILSSSSEMAYKGKTGLDLYIDKVNLREFDMEPFEIMLSESQERMLFCADTKGVDEILKIACENYLSASVIGKTTQNNRYRIFKKDNILCDLPVEILSECICYDLNNDKPLYLENFKNRSQNFDDIQDTETFKNMLYKITSDTSFASKDMIFETYDYTVQNRTVLKPNEAGAASLWIYEEDTYVGFTMDSNPSMVFLNPYEGTKNTVYESARNLISSGFKPLGITNCLNFGNPENNEVSYQFIESVKGLADAAKELNIPVVSGNVSFYNESGNQRVYPTPVIAMTGRLYGRKNIKIKTADGCKIYLIGKQISKDSDIGGCLYQRILFDYVGGEVDKTDSSFEKKLFDTLINLHEKKLISGAMDVSKGGILGSLIIMLLNSQLGFKASKNVFEPNLKLMFGEINSRYIISTPIGDEVEKYLIKNNIPFRLLGTSIDSSQINLGFDTYSFEKLNTLYYTSLKNKSV